MGYLLGLALVVVTIWLYVKLHRARAEADIGLSPEELKTKKALEDMADRIADGL
jgi:hypothetical protein